MLLIPVALKSWKATMEPNDDAINNISIQEDALEQTIVLTGITAGNSENQPLRVTATSSDTDLVPHPTVTYTTSNATGSLTFTPAADEHGTATITVTVEAEAPLIMICLQPTIIQPLVSLSM